MNLLAINLSCDEFTTDKFTISNDEFTYNKTFGIFWWS